MTLASKCLSVDRRQKRKKKSGRSGGQQDLEDQDFSSEMETKIVERAIKPIFPKIISGFGHSRGKYSRTDPIAARIYGE